MDKTPEEILSEQYSISEYRYPVIHASVQGVFRAMEQYAEQEAKSYAAWLSNQVIHGRTMQQLWDDYKAETK